MLKFKTSTSSGKEFSLDKAAVPLLLSFILTVMTIHCGFLAVEFGFNANDAKPIPFDSKAWKENKDPLARYLMAKDSNFDRHFKGLTKAQVTEILGPPDEQPWYEGQDTLAYQIKFGYRCDGDSVFELSTKAGVVDKEVQGPLICYGEIGLLDYLLPFRVGDDGNFYWQQWHDIEVLKRLLHI